MVKKLLALLFTSVLVFSLSTPVFAQESSKKEEAKETPAQEKAEKKAGKQARMTRPVAVADQNPTSWDTSRTHPHRRHGSPGDPSESPYHAVPS